jgi:hypothetical protein
MNKTNYLRGTKLQFSSKTEKISIPRESNRNIMLKNP